jgi:8-oxo-dGTP pyrophosphatase MutT (NUDIX family)
MTGAPGTAVDPPTGDAGQASLLAELRKLPLDAPSDCAANAAVTIILRVVPQGFETLLLVRAERVGDFSSGQIGLPGGRRETGDPGLRITALRELHEEVGVRELDLVPPFVFLQSTPARAFGLEVAVFLTRSKPGSPEPVAADPSEVAEVFWMPLLELMRVEKVERTHGESRFEVEATNFEGRILWGFTRRVLLEASHQLKLLPDSPGR